MSADEGGAGASPAAEVSVQDILRNQRDNGAFVASPDFREYQYCWLRDGSFTAYALDRAGRHQAAERFHLWSGVAISGVRDLMVEAIARRAAGLVVDASRMPPARFALDGSAVHDDWPNFQVDGYGTWLWSLRQHLLTDGGRALPSELVPAVECAASYLVSVGHSPCYDVWEEAGNFVHTSTLACVYGGLVAATELLDDPGLGEHAGALRDRLTAPARRRGYFTKWEGNEEVDGSLLWLCRPFGVVEASDETFVETTRRVMTGLELEGGTRRYPSDTYYGSGAWPVLTASLGWCLADMGDLPGARARLAWVVERIDEQGRLAEQYGGESRDPQHYHEWVQRWGPPAADLVWSHAMHVVLAHELDLSPATTTNPVPPSLPAPNAHVGQMKH